MKKSISLAIALSAILVATFATFQTGNAVASVKYDYTKTTITLNETVEFSAEVNSFSNMTWFCDDVAVQSGLGMSSAYTFIPKAIGTYFIKLSVDGFTNPPPAGPTRVTVIAEPITSPTPTHLQKPSPTPTNRDERFVVQHTFWAFAGFDKLCSFAATAGDYLELNISSVNIDPDRPNDVYVVDLEIASVNHGTTFISGTRFTQTIPLNYSDTYTVAADKHQFWSSVTISGEIDLRHISTTLSPLPTVPEFPSWIIPLLLTTMVASAGLFVHNKKKYKRNLVKEGLTEQFSELVKKP